MAPNPPARHIGIPHLPALDGLRGLAVLGVLIFHDGHLRGGYLGVDLFFVLSGYLITSLLLAEWGATGRIVLSAFWVRRARRLFPALLALLPAVAIYAALLAAPAELARIRGDGLATLAYVANWYTLAAGKSYWELFSAPSPLEHTWSLAIEEQFYVIWPFLTVLVLRLSRGSARALLAASAALALLSGAAMWRLYAPESTSRAYLGTDARGAAILAGAALACAVSTWGTLKSDRAVRALDAAGVAATAVLAYAWATLDGQSPRLYHGGFWLTEIAVLVLIACAAHGDRSLISRLFGARPLAGVGLVSYGVYLWHWPLYVVLRQERLGFGGIRLSAIRLLATFVVALISYRYLEQPIRKRGLPPGWRPIVVVPAAAAFAVLSIVLSTRRAATPEMSAAVAGIRDLPDAGALPEGTTKVLVLGDSVAVSLAERLHFVQGPFKAAVIGRGMGDCSILHDQLNTKSLNNKKHDGGDCDAKWASDVAEVHPDVTLVALGGGFFAPVEIGKKWERPCEKGWHEAYGKELQRGVESLRAGGGRVFLTVAPYPVGRWTDATPKRLIDCYNDTIREVAAAVPGVTLLDLQAQLCPGGECAIESNGAPIRADGLHFTGPGSEEIARWILGRLSIR